MRKPIGNGSGRANRRDGAVSLLGWRSWGRPLSDDASTATAAPAGGPEASSGEPDAATHLLVYNDPDDPAEHLGMGWTLITHPDRARSRTMSLAARGAGAHAPARVAQAVAVRVLGEQGVDVAGWDDAGARDHTEVTTFRARLVPQEQHRASPPQPAPRRVVPAARQ